ncbi:E3 ubiquitin-protein ligase listerin isoform X2 [Cloeon dipterum]|uniref:E3 ubiquitin-protein ligase listerin isoform X2 n=1 Tax=Cloeon dipterum TaxID=197152 RepID=UPI0032206B1B
MGKNNKAQRTKNNARPSSSGRSAQLLETNVSFSSHQAEGFGSPLPSFAGLSNLTLDDGESQSLDPQTQLILKKLNKKDAVTRQKGLQELGEVCVAAEEQEIKAILKLWPRMFSSLSTDPDHRVREATFVAHKHVAKKAGRNLAPYLKNLSGPWFVGQFDTFAPASSAAQAAFKDSFPDKKYEDAVKYCQKEILSYISENMLSQTIETVAYEKSLSPDELEARMERVLTSNLKAYNSLLSEQPTSQIKEMAEANKAITTSNKFWKLNKHKSPFVRRAWFTAMASILHTADFLLEGQAAQTVPAIFGSLDESDPIVLSSVWDAALSAIISIKDCWSHVNCEKVVFPKLWHVLKEGGYGNSATIFPNMLPLISKVEPKDKTVFTAKFFSNMLIGLGQKSVLQSLSESSAIVTAYIECLRYVINIEDVKESKETLVKQQLLPLLNACILDRKFHLTINALALQLSNLLPAWNSSNLDEPIWWHFGSMLSDFNESSELNHQSFVELVVLLADPSKIKKPRRVNFAGGDDEHIKKVDSEPEERQTVAYWQPLLRIATCAATYALDAALTTKSPEKLVSTLFHLVKAFKSEEFFKTVRPSVFSFYEDIFKLLNEERGDSKEIIKMIFLLFEFLDQDEKSTAYDNFTKIADRSILLCCIEEAVHADKLGEKSVIMWLRSAGMSDVMLTLAKEVSNMLESTEKQKSTSWTILKLCFSPSTQHDKEIFANFNTVSAIMLIFCEALAVPKTALDDRTTLESYANFIGELMSSLFSQQFKLCENTLQELLLGTFKLCCSSIGLSPAASDSLQNALVNGVMHLKYSSKNVIDMSKKFASVVRHEFSFMNLKPVTCIGKFLETVNCTEAFEVFLNGQPKYQGWQKQLEDACMLNEVVQGVYWPKGNKIPLATSVDCIFDFTVETLLRANLLLEMLNRKAALPNEAYSDLKGEVPIEELETELEFNSVYSDAILKEMTSLIQAFVICDKTVSHYKNNPNCSKISVDISMLKHVMDTLSVKLPPSFISKNFAVMFDSLRAGNYPAYWVVVQLCQWDDHLPDQLCDALAEPVAEVLPWRLWLFQWQAILCGKPNVTGQYYREGNELLDKKDPLCARYFTDFQAFMNHTEEVDKLLDLVIKWSKLEYWKSAFEGDLEEHNQFIAVITFLTRLIEINASKLHHTQWDTVLCSLAGYLQNAKKFVVQQPTNPIHAAKLVSLCPLVKNIQFFMKILEKGSGTKTNVSKPENLLDEWKSLFVPEFYSILMSFYFASMEATIVPLFEQTKMSAVGSCLASVPQDWLVQLAPPKHMVKQHKLISNQEKRVQDLVLLLAPLLHSTDRNLKVTAYHLLKKMLKELVKKDEEYLLSVDTDAVDTKKLACELLEKELAETHEVVKAMLSDFRVGDCCIVQPFTDGHIYTYSYLMIWSLLLDMCKEAKSELRYQLSCWLNNGGYTKTMLEIVFRLMPDYVIQPFHGNADRVVSKEASEMFTHEHSPSYEGKYTSGSIMKMACWIYLKSLLHLPALVRDWWTDLDPQMSGLVERLTASLVSKHVIGIEMKSVLERKESCTELEIKVHPLAREVIATYTVDEVRMELTVTLPVNHPLGPIRVEGNNTIDIAKWKQWVKQLTIFLTHQNGSIWDGLMLWKRNLDNKFQGVEECYICYSILHSSNYQIPKLSCRTCHKKFHSSCLYRWFHTSNNSTCPLCRNLF